MCGLNSVTALANPLIAQAKAILPHAPSAPDPTATANAQQQMNINSAIAQQNLNRVNQFTPYGSLTYQQTGVNADGTPQYSQTVALSPEMKSLYDSQVKQDMGLTTGENQLIGQINSNIGKSSDTSSFDPVTGGMGGSALTDWQNKFRTGAQGGQIQTQLSPQDLQTQFHNAQDAAYQSQMGYLNPQFNDQRQQTIDQLQQQGITQQSNPAAYQHAMDQLNRDQTFKQQQAFDSSYQSGINAQNALFNQNLQSGEFANAAQAQGFGQDLSNAGLNNQVLDSQLAGYATNAGLNNAANSQEFQNLFALQNQPINQLSALRGVSQVQNPTFGSTPQASVSAPNYLGLTQQNYANQLGSYNNFMSGLFSLGGSAIGSSMKPTGG